MEDCPCLHLLHLSRHVCGAGSPHQGRFPRLKLVGPAMLKEDAVKLTNRVFEIHRFATALAREGKHQEAIAELRTCLNLAETLAADAPGKQTRQQNLMVVLHALADSLGEVGEKEESKALRERGFDILF